MKPELLASISGIALSLIFSYIPGLKNKFDELQSDYKRLVMLGVLLLTAAGIFGFGCLGQYDEVTCDVAGAWQMVEVFIVAAIANQSAYALTPKGE